MPLPKFEGHEYEFPHELEEKAQARQSKSEEDDFQYEVEDDTPEPDRGRKAAPPPEDPTDDELNSYDEKVQTRIKKFTRGYHDERRAKEAALREREAAEEFARQVYEENKRLKGQLKSGSEVFIEQNKSSAQIELDAAKKRFKDAFEAGDSDEVTSAQEAIAKATLKIDRAESMRPIEEPDNFQPPAREKAEPATSPRTKKWLEKNGDWFGADDEMTMAAMGLDKKLQREYGADYIGTDDYFKRIDSTMRKRFPEYFGSHEEDEPPQKTTEPEEDDTPPRRATRSASPVAPATRSTPPTRIRLRASQAAIARRLGVPIEEYAKQVAQLRGNE